VIFIVLIKQLAKVELEASGLGGKWLDNVLNAQVKTFLLDEV